ncbi:MAG TPA: ADOP family duplicated permease [Terracidiphilus sp.]|jgi:predicted permease
MRLLEDMRDALRQLRRSPGFSFAAVLTLALGIGASSAIFCLMDAHWLHPIRVPHPGQLVRVFATTPQNPDGAFTYSEYQALSQRAASLQSTVALGRRGSLMPRTDGTSALLLTNVVSANFFEALGVRPLLGRAFTPADAALLRTHPGVLLGYDFWRREFSGDPNIVGRRITLMRGEHTRNQVDIWGVLPAGFREIDNGEDRDLWMPAETWAAIAKADDLTSPEFRWFNVLGRLAPGSTVARVNDQASAIAKGWQSADPAAHHDRGARAVSDFRYRMASAGASGLILFAIVGSVVLLATVNVAHLLLARALARSPEVALRMALGARRLTLARQLLIENLLLCLLSLTAGLAIAAGIAALLPRLLVQQPAMLVQVGSNAAAFQLDWRVFSFASLLALATMLLLALVPLRQVARPELLPVLQAASATRTAAPTPQTQRIAIWLQIAISFALLVSTGALVRSFLNTRTQSIGLTRNQVLLAWTQEPDPEMRDAVFARMKSLPGVERAAYAIRAPLSLSEGGIAVKAVLPSHPELRDPVEIKFNAVSPDFLAVTGTRVLRGRGFTQADDQNGPPVVLINQAMAQRYWPGGDPIGQIVRLSGSIHTPDSSGEARIVGVTENAPINQIGEIAEPYLYVPFHFSTMGEMTFALQTGPDAMSLAQPVRQLLIHTHPLLDPMMVTSLPELIRYSSGNYQMMAELVSALGLIGLALTVVGLYGFLAFRVTQRRREIGIRMALGASREATSILIVRDTAAMALVGLALGLLLALAAARFESSLLFGVTPLDALSLTGALCILAAAIAVASWLPARRAASIDPIQALRTE